MPSRASVWAPQQEAICAASILFDPPDIDFCGVTARRRPRVARIAVGGRERALDPAAGARRTGEPAGDIRGRCPRRRLLLGRPGRVSACRGRHQRRLRLCRRRRRYGALRDGRHQIRPGTRNRSGSPSTPTGSAMAVSCRSIFRSPMIRPSSTARARMSGPSIARQFSRPIRSRRALPRPISPS